MDDQSFLAAGAATARPRTPPPACAGGTEDAAGATDHFDTSEMMRQVFLRALSVPSPETRRRMRRSAEPRSS
ncbi:hypothetical protein ACWGB8_23275 [Kitasatospora sp. NPDC054939]